MELIIHYENINPSERTILNKEKILAYYNDLKVITEELNYTSNKELIGYALQLPEVIHHSKEIIDEKNLNTLLKYVEKACNDLIEFRKKEGLALKKELKQYLNTISKNLKAINLYEKVRLSKVKEKLLKAIDELKLKSKIDEKRLEQELIYYAEKLDVTEEKVRLKEHCIHFNDTLKEEGSGKKLGFITQEIGREINTLGSKAHNIDIQKLVVGMKDDLEKIKEQVLNIL